MYSPDSIRLSRIKPDFVGKKRIKTALNPIAGKIGDCLNAICHPKKYWV